MFFICTRKLISLKYNYNYVTEYATMIKRPRMFSRETYDTAGDRYY